MVLPDFGAAAPRLFFPACTPMIAFYAWFYELWITLETEVIPGVTNNSVLSTPNLALSSK